MAKMNNEQIERWSNYAIKIQCERRAPRHLFALPSSSRFGGRIYLLTI